VDSARFPLSTTTSNSWKSHIDSKFIEPHSYSFQKNKERVNENAGDQSVFIAASSLSMNHATSKTQEKGLGIFWADETS